MRALRPPSRSSRSLRLRIGKPSKQDNLLDHPERSPHNRRLRQQTKKFRDATDRPGISRDTPLMPWIIADTVCAEASLYLNSEIPLRYVDALDQKAERCYARGSLKPTSKNRSSAAISYQHFRQRIRARGNAGRSWLYAFMRHWLFALLTRNHPTLARRLPREYAIGHPIPLQNEK